MAKEAGPNRSGVIAMAADAAAERKRINLVLPDRSARRLNALVKKTEASSYTDVLKKAIRLYEEMIAEIERGSEICIREKDGSIKTYRFLFGD